MKNINEFGSVKNELDYNNLQSYLPLHNIKEGVKYVNFLLISGSTDDRVPPFHSYKFLAILQNKGSNASLYELFLLNSSGHIEASNSKSLQKR